MTPRRWIVNQVKKPARIWNTNEDHEHETTRAITTSNKEMV
jgi:hypothetical protein